jgi:hypothetical protein
MRMSYAGASRVGNNGKNIVLAIISANTERAAMGMGGIWPSTNACVNPNRPNYDYTKDSVSETYFADLVGRTPKDAAADNLSWFVFAGGGIPTAATAEQFEQGGFNAWNYIAGLDKDAPDDAPLLITANSKIDRRVLERFSAAAGGALGGGEINAPSSAEIKALFSPCNPKPLGGDSAIFIQKGGGFQVLQRKFFSPAQLLGSSRFDAIHNPGAKVIGAAKGALNSGK